MNVNIVLYKKKKIKKIIFYLYLGNLFIKFLVHP